MEPARRQPYTALDMFSLNRSLSSNWLISNKPNEPGLTRTNPSLHGASIRSKTRDALLSASVQGNWGTLLTGCESHLRPGETGAQGNQASEWEPTPCSQVCFQLITFLHGKFFRHIHFMGPCRVSPPGPVLLLSCRELPKLHSPGVGGRGKGKASLWDPTASHHPLLNLHPHFQHLLQTFKTLPSWGTFLWPEWLLPCIKTYQSVVSFPANLIRKYILLWWWFNMWHQTTYQSLSFLLCIFSFNSPQVLSNIHM